MRLFWIVCFGFFLKISSVIAIVEDFKSLKQINKWKRIGEVKLKFKTHHPQGLYILGEKGFLSSVEIQDKPKRFDKPDKNGFDRNKGKGRAHLFVFNVKNGQLIKKVDLSDGDFYHPGGLEFDGKRLWTAVAHYRPKGLSKIISIDPESLEVKEHFRVQDHIGALIFDRDAQKLLGLNWGGRQYYEWKFDRKTETFQQESVVDNPNLYIDYQDCQYLLSHKAVCFGLARFKLHLMSSTAIGGVELIDTLEKRPLYQVPVLEWLKPYLTMTNNPSFLSKKNGALTFFFIPEDDDSSLYMYNSVNRFP